MMVLARALAWFGVAVNVALTGWDLYTGHPAAAGASAAIASVSAMSKVLADRWVALLNARLDAALSAVRLNEEMLARSQQIAARMARLVPGLFVEEDAERPH